MCLISHRRSLFAAGIVLVVIPAVLLAAPVPAVPAEPSPSRAEQLREKLEQSVDFTAVAEWTLKDSLDWLTDRYDLAFDVDTRAFAAKKIADARGVNIAPVEGWSMKQVKLTEVLRKILRQGPLGESEATYVIVGDVILITTNDVVLYRWMRQRVTVDCEKVELSLVLKKLARETATNLVIDPLAANETKTPVTLQLQDVTLETAICLMAEMVDLKPVRVGNVLFITTKPHAAEMRADKERAALIGPCPLPSNPKVPPR